MATIGSPLTLFSQLCDRIQFGGNTAGKGEASFKTQVGARYVLGQQVAGSCLNEVLGKTVCRAAFCWLYGIGHEHLSNLHLFITGARDATDYHCYSYSCESGKQKTVVEWITSRVIESHLCDRDGGLVDDLLDEKMPAERVRFNCSYFL
ncbi:hypothetical protein Pelo_19370 [Pelomyxa schiedti]|nr:hypothetical protein Pelo_19370 [Pelomyxa schiedti]